MSRYKVTNFAKINVVLYWTLLDYINDASCVIVIFRLYVLAMKSVKLIQYTVVAETLFTDSFDKRRDLFTSFGSD